MYTNESAALNSLRNVSVNLSLAQEVTDMRCAELRPYGEGCAQAQNRSYVRVSARTNCCAQRASAELCARTEVCARSAEHCARTEVCARKTEVARAE